MIDCSLFDDDFASEGVFAHVMRGERLLKGLLCQLLSWCAARQID